MLARLLCAVAISLLSSSGYAAQEQNYPFSIENEKEGDGHRIVARNNGPAPVSVKVSIIDSQYIAPDRPFPVYAVVPPGGGTLYLARIRPAISGVGYTFRTQFTWLLGDFNAAQSPDALYRLPFPDGVAYHIGQAPGGPITTHSSPDSQYAVDIGMPEGAPVVAARDGVVVSTEAGQTEGGQTPEMLTKANAVRIRHVDGTIAVYAHLAHGGVFVYPGQQVSAGQQIGLAGSTGYSSGPHLHFAVQTVRKNSDGFELISLPFRFYVGNPPAAFSPQFRMLAKADYDSPGEIPGLDAPARLARTQSPSSSSGPAASGGSEVAVSLQVPDEVRAYLLRIPTWKWFAGMVAVAVLLAMLDKFRTARRQQIRRDRD